jgi:hypothetical protein
MGKIYVIGWDADLVMYPGLSTSICAEKSPLDPQIYLDDFFKKNWFTKDDVGKWAQTYNEGKSIQTVGDLARCLTDFLYKMKKGEVSVITKEQTIEGKQAILKGLTMKQIREISDSIEYTPGLEEAVRAFKKDGLYQTLFSDGLGPHITHQRRKLGLDAGMGIPAIITINGGEEHYNDLHLSMDDASLTGKVLTFYKATGFFSHIDSLRQNQKFPLENVAVIDDSGANVEILLLPVQKAGGIAIGFNPTEAHKPMFKKHSIPVLEQKERDLGPFIEIVQNPTEATIGKYCR